VPPLQSHGKVEGLAPRYRVLLADSNTLRKECVSIFGSNFALRCFQCLSLGVWLRGLPCRTAAKLETPARCSSRTRRTLPSNTRQNQ